MTVRETFSKFPSWIPQKSWVVILMLMCTAFNTGTVLGYDASMMNALNILPQYTEYFNLTPATTGLNSGIIWIGATLGSAVIAKLPDHIGRRPSAFYSGLIAMVGGILTAASQNTAMFLVSRFILGLGIGCSYVVTPVYISETLPLDKRALGLGLINDVYYVGGLVSAGITYGTSYLNSTWAWRLPAIFQIVFTLISLLALPFAPESPRFLVYQGRKDEALLALAQISSNGDTSDAAVKLQFIQVCESLDYEKEADQTVGVKELWTNKSYRKRLFIAFTVAVFSMMTGSNIFSYYLGTALTNAGFTDSTIQLEVNIILNAFCLVICLIGTCMADRLGRKTLALISTGLCTITLFIIGALTKFYGTSSNKSAIYANIAMMFLAQGFYSFGWTPILQMYAPELMNYQLRSIGVSWCITWQNAIILVPIFAFPIAMANIGWVTYIMNGGWNIFQIVVIAIYWVETKGLSLEEISALFDGEVHSQVTNVKDIINGVSAGIDDEKVVAQVQAEILKD
ncbi:hypothetical protein PFICI_08866 [Pestalotiopsis fici W106-1]|uniref:Major facilitator superfamily (MFS) profile domain-containing protein n=1 Tax=Pestalotiopsis fici (strain W106-1 / CGMCC3.15140) TaxID=1229662 RepID=W3WYQ8_PESFW|nr:uncharacterized protein PFICI_08866 [Pestalotiopsis fici W106-1]ETS79013.1 hypothetical protein PFICI_08866 [Pestalotiopsis fici W106-1]